MPLGIIPSGPNVWQPGLDYGIGVQVEFGYQSYICIEAHRSTGKNNPGRAPELWRVL